jgi:hypothetical protein
MTADLLPALVNRTLFNYSYFHQNTFGRE